MMRPARRERAGSERPSADTTPAVTDPPRPCGLPIATTSWPTRRRSASPSVAGASESPAVAQHGQVGERVAADDLEARLVAVGERRSAAGRAAADHVRVGEQEAVRGERDRAARPRRHLAAAHAPHHAQAGDRGPDALGHGDHRARVGVERLGLGRGRWAAGPPPRRSRRRSAGLELDLHGALLGAAHDGQLERAALRDASRAPRRGRRPSRAPRRRGGEQVARARCRRRRRGCRPRPPAPAGPRARAARPRGACGAPPAAGAIATPSRGVAGASPRARPLDALLDGGRGGHRQDQAAVEAKGVQSRAAVPSTSTSGPPDEPRGSGAVCSIASADAAPARAAEAASVRRDEARASSRRPRPPGLASASTGVPMPGRVAGLPGDRRDVAGVDAR